MGVEHQMHEMHTLLGLELFLVARHPGIVVTSALVASTVLDVSFIDGGCDRRGISIIS